MTIGSRRKWWWGQRRLMSGLLGAELTENLHHNSSEQSPYSAPKIPGAGTQCGSNPSEGPTNPLVSPPSACLEI